MANDKPKPVVKKAFTPRDTSKPMSKPAAPKKVVKIDSGAKPTKPYEGSKTLSYSARVGRGEAAQEARANSGQSMKTPVVKIHSSEGVLGQSHMGGHSDVAGGGFSDLERGGGRMGQLK